MKPSGLMLILLAVLWACLLSPAVGADALIYVNARRASIGLYPFSPDPQLLVLAERESQLQATRGRMRHFNGCPRPARAAGVGYTSKRDALRWFNACYCVSRKHTYAGASAVTSANGSTYFTIMLR